MLKTVLLVNSSIGTHLVGVFYHGVFLSSHNFQGNVYSINIHKNNAGNYKICMYLKYILINVPKLENA